MAAPLLCTATGYVQWTNRRLTPVSTGKPATAEDALVDVAFEVDRAIFAMARDSGGEVRPATVVVLLTDFHAKAVQ